MTILKSNAVNAAFKRIKYQEKTEEGWTMHCISPKLVIHFSAGGRNMFNGHRAYRITFCLNFIQRMLRRFC
ncbi:MAG: hypothetical protein EA361_14130 [Bacteroidetes bacterium]|nr:MAG: hypothetical protein EA361_14130 [Bacteroidota bacterium]